MSYGNKKWYECPECKKKLIQYRKGDTASDIFLLCKNCKKKLKIKINKK